MNTSRVAIKDIGRHFESGWYYRLDELESHELNGDTIITMYRRDAPVDGKRIEYAMPARVLGAG